jgi:uncharacterized membrane protein YkvA (DUF1232 family)
MNTSFKKMTRSYRNEFDTYRLVLNDPRTPKAAKFFLGSAIAYALSPIDLIPDFVPLLGYLDDLVIVPLLIFAGLSFVSREVIEDCREKASLTKKGLTRHSTGCAEAAPRTSGIRRKKR